jgi:hypothetical protein
MSSINPNEPEKSDQLLDGSFINTLMDDNDLNVTERSWIESLTKIVTQEISLSISLEDFKKFFKAKQERTSSSPFGRHMGHYKTMMECIHRDTPLLPDMIISIACI